MTNERCRYCNSDMRASDTTFSVVKDVVAYVVRSVPCLECPECGEVVFTQETALKLSKFASGKVYSYRQPLTAIVFRWGDSLEETSVPTSSRTENRSVVNPVGTNKMLVR